MISAARLVGNEWKARTQPSSCLLVPVHIFDKVAYYVENWSYDDLDEDTWSFMRDMFKEVDLFTMDLFGPALS